MSDPRPILTLVKRIVSQSGIRYVVLFDGSYWHCSQAEYDGIQQGYHPEDLGMFPFASEDEE